jgi:hypothetical protein
MQGLSHTYKHIFKPYLIQCGTFNNILDTLDHVIMSTSYMNLTSLERDKIISSFSSTSMVKLNSFDSSSA